MTAPKQPKRPRRQCAAGAELGDRCPAFTQKGKRWCKPHGEEKRAITQERLDKQEAKMNAQLAKIMQRREELLAKRALYPDLYPDG